jgi:hypothetical protein
VRRSVAGYEEAKLPDAAERSRAPALWRLLRLGQRLSAGVGRLRAGDDLGRTGRVDQLASSPVR